MRRRVEINRRRGRVPGIFGPLALTVLCGWPALPALGAGPAAAGVVEELPYRWHLGGYRGLLARLIVPGAGEAILRTTALDSGGLRKELLITSPQSRGGEFWRYVSEVESTECRRLTSARNEQLFRGRAKERRADIDEEGVLDIPSCICRIRRDPPARPMAARIWSDGKIYPVRISGPVAGEATRGGRLVPTSSYEVTGVRHPDARGWKGRLELVLALDEERTPLEIALTQPGLAVRLRLDEQP